jgi:hypothetical protein
VENIKVELRSNDGVTRRFNFAIRSRSKVRQSTSAYSRHEDLHVTPKPRVEGGRVDGTADESVRA